MVCKWQENRKAGDRVIRRQYLSDKNLNRESYRSGGNGTNVHESIRDLLLYRKQY